MKQLLKIVLILLDSPLSQCTDVKTYSLILWFNCEFRIESDNKKYEQKHPNDSQFFGFQNKNAVYVLF